MLQAKITGVVIDKDIYDKNGKKYYNLYILQDGQRSSQQVGVNEATYNQASKGQEVKDLPVKIYSNKSAAGNAFLSVSYNF